MDYEEISRRREQTYQPDPSGTRLIPVEAGKEHHHDKKPVLKKVKEKVKKIKDTLNVKKHGHDDEHDRDDDHDTSEEEKEEGYEENEEDNVQDPEAHGAPSGEEIETSPVIQSFEAMAISDQPHVWKEEVVQESTPPTGIHDQFSPAAAPAAEEDRPQSTEEPKGPSYTEKLSTTAAAAVSAAAGSTEYGKKIASAVYEKVAEAGTAVKAKVEQKPSGTTATDGGDATATQDKGKVASVREYLVEKLRPGEEDRALSEVISEALQKRKEVAAEAPEVTGSSARGGGVRVVEKIRGAVTSLVGGGGGSRASPAGESTQTKAEEGQAETRQEPEGQKQEEHDLE
ncbi:putative low-temperature-induced 65 kDa protein [Cocos nucifera]|uniref:Putative low-temperature-induced 65 kDa protein n=1 Tax=Cocos nucifera TaxID=13894 RepID=A0A8K0IFV1_COCNU|nr:putative low-temperature-induced 65 kDa protein [Cocos nucifera]